MALRQGCLHSKWSCTQMKAIGKHHNGDLIHIKSKFEEGTKNLIGFNFVFAIGNDGVMEEASYLLGELEEMIGWKDSSIDWGD